jgi:hypothetical protein
MKSATKAQVWVHAKLERLRVQLMREMLTKGEAFDALKKSPASIEQEESKPGGLELRSFIASKTNL